MTLKTLTTVSSLKNKSVHEHVCTKSMSML